MKFRQEILGAVQRLVVKVGSGLLTDAQNRLATGQIRQLAQQLAAAHRQNRQVLVVSSGAIAAGMGQLGLAHRPKRLDELQAAAAIGQSKLMAVYDEMFGQAGLTVAQILLTHDDLRDRTRHLNARSTLAALLARGIIPIINENDSVAVDEIKFGDNDRLAALTATLIDADLLVILSHVEGLYRAWDKDSAAAPRQVIPTVTAITREIERLAGGTDRLTSVGGMRSKIEAARIVTRAGIPLIIANGERPTVLGELLTGDEIGTIFLPQPAKLASRKRWIAFFQRSAGTLIVDEGAKQALCGQAKSLLARGVTAAVGEFQAGDLVSICDQNKVEFARGLAKVNSAKLAASSGVVVHRDDLVIL